MASSVPVEAQMNSLRRIPEFDEIKPCLKTKKMNLNETHT
tara:strand:- start:299 stop:418 length:120 start_codon:yes stop_codon:yes gene_type:complete